MSSTLWKAPWQEKLPTQDVYYVDDYYVLYHADNRDVLPRLSGLQFTGLTDPVYNIGKDYGTCKDDMPEEDYLEFCNLWIGRMMQLCPKNAIVTPNKWLLDYWKQLGKGYKQVVLTWAAANALRANWIACYTMILTNMTPLKNGVPDWWPDMQKAGLGFLTTEETYGHPGYTSEAITNRILAELCPGDTVILDPFGGTGTTAWCCKMRTRPCVIIEIDKGWCKTIVDRCSQDVFNFG